MGLVWAWHGVLGLGEAGEQRVTGHIANIVLLKVRAWLVIKML
jgi:hypothetical protein